MYMAELIMLYGTIIIGIGVLINFIIYMWCNKEQVKENEH